MYYYFTCNSFTAGKSKDHADRSETNASNADDEGLILR